MPTYEYECRDCKHRVDYFQPMSEAPRTECPRCSGRLSRLVSSGAGLIFKGSGFYITDYKRSQSGPPSTGSQSSVKNKRDAKIPEKKTKETATAAKVSTPTDS